MSYFLGIDLGTTYTAAAVWRDGRVDIADLGSRTPVIPSVVLLREDGTIITGEAAVRRAVLEPQRVAREFKRRFGDPTPIIVGGTPLSADTLTSKLVRAVVDRVTETECGPPTGIAVSHPANWGEYKTDLLRQAIRLADLEDVTTLSEPEAAAIHYASQERVDPGSVVAVYDLGGGTFDAAVLRRTEGSQPRPVGNAGLMAVPEPGANHGWEILGRPEGVERLGGVDFDQAVFHHVTNALGDAFEQLDPDDPTTLAAVTRLRQECVEAKEALATDTDVTIPVLLPTVQTDVRLTRSEFESMIRPAIGDSINALHRALRSARVTAQDVSAVLLVGGSSRIPLVAQLVGSAFVRPVAVDAHPKHGVALGAAIIAAEKGSSGAVETEAAEIAEPAIPALYWAAGSAAAAPAPQLGLAGAELASAVGGATVGPAEAVGAIAGASPGLTAPSGASSAPPFDPPPLGGPGFGLDPTVLSAGGGADLAGGVRTATPRENPTVPDPTETLPPPSSSAPVPSGDSPEARLAAAAEDQRRRRRAAGMLLGGLVVTIIALSLVLILGPGRNGDPAPAQPGPANANSPEPTPSTNNSTTTAPSSTTTTPVESPVVVPDNRPDPPTTQPNPTTSTSSTSTSSTTTTSTTSTTVPTTTTDPPAG